MPHTSSSEDDSDLENNSDVEKSEKLEYKIVNNGNDSVDDQSDEADEEEEESIDLAPKGNETVDIEFSFCDPIEDDFNMIKALIHNGSTLWFPGIDSSALANDICEQSAVGTTVKVDDEVYGYLSALSSKYYGKQAYFQGFVEALTDQCPKDHKKELNTLLKAKDFAWVVEERMVNLPYQLIKPLYQSLFDDIEWSQNNVEATGGDQEMFDFSKFLIVLPYHTSDELEVEDAFDSDSDEDEDESAEDGKKRKRKVVSSGAQKKRKPDGHSNPQFVHPESLHLYQNALFTIPLKLCTPDVVVEKAKGAVPFRHRAKYAYVCALDKAAYKKAVAKM